MADNRLYLRCNRCSEEFPLARFWLHSYKWTPARIDFETDVGAFLEKHEQCGVGRPDASDELGLDVSLSTENDDAVTIRQPEETRE